MNNHENNDGFFVFVVKESRNTRNDAASVRRRDNASMSPPPPPSSHRRGIGATCATLSSKTAVGSRTSAYDYSISPSYSPCIGPRLRSFPWALRFPPFSAVLSPPQQHALIATARIPNRITPTNAPTTFPTGVCIKLVNAEVAPPRSESTLSPEELVPVRDKVNCCCSVPTKHPLGQTLGIVHHSSISTKPKPSSFGPPK